MKTLTVRIESLHDAGKSILAAIKTGSAEKTAGLSFPSYEAMHRTLSPKRLEIIRVMAGQGPLSYREVARRAGRDFKGVHTDVTAMILAGIVERDARGVMFPYDTMHFDFDVQAKAA